MTERCDDPLGLAREHHLMEKDGSVCPHGVDMFEGRLQYLVNSPEWMCRCCCHRFQSAFYPMPEGGLCRDCDGSREVF